jgi:hypothetical protein
MSRSAAGTVTLLHAAGLLQRGRIAGVRNCNWEDNVSASNVQHPASHPE